MTPLTPWYGLAFGLVLHAGKQMITAKRAGGTFTLRTYYVAHWPESLFSIGSALAMYFALPDLAVAYPDAAKLLGLASGHTFLAGVACGIIGNSFADVIGNRAQQLIGKQ